jgi:cardiolipin synthase
MIHAKIMIVDKRWAVVGSTNFDSRSFELNDEVNLALVDAGVAARLAVDFEKDLEQSRRVKLEDWRRRSLLERLVAAVCIVLERQE